MSISLSSFFQKAKGSFQKVIGQVTQFCEPCSLPQGAYFCLNSQVVPTSLRQWNTTS